MPHALASPRHHGRRPYTPISIGSGTRLDAFHGKHLDVRTGFSLARRQALLEQIGQHALHACQLTQLAIDLRQPREGHRLHPAPVAAVGQVEQRADLFEREPTACAFLMKRIR